MKKIFGILLIISGVITTSYGSLLIWQRYDRNALTFSHFTPQDQRQSKARIPVQLEIPYISLTVPIAAARVSSGVWPLFSDRVTYVENSPLPGTPGNSILYGHNWPSLLGTLSSVRTGERISIIMSDGQREDFKISGIAVLSPQDHSVLLSNDEKRITIYTCAGLFDQNRLVVTGIKIPAIQPQLSRI